MRATYTALFFLSIALFAPHFANASVLDAETGGDCTSFGTWDSSTLTCTLTTDLADTLIIIDSDSITLDGAEHVIGEVGSDAGVYIDSLSKVTVKNLIFKQASFGVFINASSQVTVTDNTFTGADIISFDSPSLIIDTNTFTDGDRGILLFSSNDAIVQGNTVQNMQKFALFFDSARLRLEGNIITADASDSDGIFIFNCQDSTIAHNSFSNVSRALFLFDASDTNDIHDNTFSNTQKALLVFDSNKNNIHNNTLSDADEGLFVFGASSANKIYHNNFINNGTNAMDYSDTLNNAFNLPKPAGGNYFDTFNESAEGCDDADADGMCDALYMFNEYFDAGQDNIPWTKQDGWGDTPVTIPNDVSNVLFLPGIEGSRLYEGTSCEKDAEEKLWEPIGESLWKILRGAGDEKVRDLFLNDEGESICDDIYTKEGDILDSAGGDIYKSFIGEMNGLKTDGTIADWKPVAYDWRLSLDDLLNNGAERDGKIYYSEATSTPYIEQTLRALASSSKTGKVTIIAHSNGGLVAKALLNQLGGPTAKSLVDKIVMVGAPQSGAPVNVGALLYGYDQGISSWGIPILHSDVARGLAINSPMAYHLLPSENYLNSIADDANHPVARFAGDAYAKEISAYGTTITNSTAFTDFLRASALNSSLIDYANSTHSTLDAWTPPDGVEVDQIAGWGADTVAGIDFYTQKSTDAITALEPTRAYRPIFTEDGDGTVPVPSALMMASSTSVKRYWVDLGKINNLPGASIKYSHKNILEIPSLQDFIKNIIENSTSSLPTYILSSQPPSTSNKKLTFFLHSPLTLQLTDSSGNVTGLAEDDSMTQDIPGSTYDEFGEVKYITVPEGNQYQLTMHGQASGTFSLDIQETTGSIIIASSTIASVPTTANTLASLTISGGIDTVSVLSVDENGDGKNMITIAPKVGETVHYVPPAPISVSVPKRSSSSGSRNLRTPAIVPVTVATGTPRTVTQPIATNTPVLTKKTKTTTAITSPKKTNTTIAQTASVYNASQQSILKKIGTVVYNGLYRFWSALKNYFNPK